MLAEFDASSRVKGGARWFSLARRPAPDDEREGQSALG
jgi:hypothetical protein